MNLWIILQTAPHSLLLLLLVQQVNGFRCHRFPTPLSPPHELLAFSLGYKWSEEIKEHRLEARVSANHCDDAAAADSNKAVKFQRSGNSCLLIAAAISTSEEKNSQQLWVFSLLLFFFFLMVFVLFRMREFWDSRHLDIVRNNKIIIIMWPPVLTKGGLNSRRSIG